MQKSLIKILQNFMYDEFGATTCVVAFYYHAKFRKEGGHLLQLKFNT